MYERNLTKNSFILLFVYLFIGIFVIEAQSPPPTGDVPAYVVQRGTVQETFVFSGVWLPRDQQTVSFEFAGTIQSINVQPNDFVTAGMVLATFPVEELQLQLEQARASLDNVIVNQNSVNVQANIARAQIDIANANLSLQRTIDAVPWTDVNGARLSLEDAQEELEAAERNYNSTVGDPANEASAIDTAYDELKAARRNVSQAQNTYWSAAQSYSVYQYGIDQASNNVLREQIDLTVLAASATDPNQTDAVADAQETVNRLTNAIQDATLIAPFDGIVLDIQVNRGSPVAAFQNVMTLALPEPLEVYASLSVDDAQRLSVGMIGICRVSNQPETAVQCVVRQNPLTGVDAVRIAASLDNVPRGQLIEVEMPIGSRENVLWLPTEAIRSFQNRTFVVVQTAEGESVVDITIGLRTRDRVEIISGLSEGDVVIGQ